MDLLDQPITEEQFYKAIYMQFREECRKRGVKPSKELFQEILDTSKFFAQCIERIHKKFRFAASHKQIVERCIQSI